MQMKMTKTTFTIALCLAAMAALPAGEAQAAVPYTAPTGDLNDNGSVDVQDIQCEVLLYTQLVLAGTPTADLCQSDAECTAAFGDGMYCRAGFTAFKVCVPSCVAATVSLGAAGAADCTDPGADDADCFGLVPKRVADLNCDGKINNVDLQFLVSVIMGKTGGPGTADYDGDGRLNFCDDDSDGDGDPDATDCKDLDPAFHAAATEVCDGKDNDCDGAIDGLDAGILLDTACLKQDGVCAGALQGPAACVGGVWTGCQDADYQAHAAAWEKIEATCDGLDNDCDGLVDADDPDVPTCGCAVAADCPPSFTTPPVCDDPATCQGTRTEADCLAGECVATVIDDDSACDGGVVADECGLYHHVVCGGAEDQLAPACEESCAGDVECDAAGHCDAGACVVDQTEGGACDEDSDCVEGLHCAGVCSVGGGVGDPCILDGDCLPGTHCDEAAGQCVEDAAGGGDCAVDGDCVAGFHCDEAAGECVEDVVGGGGCAVDGDCVVGFHCDEAAGLCVEDTTGGGVCVTDSDCVAGFHCEAALCAEDVVGGGGCVVDADCAAGFHCDEAAGTCAADGGVGDACVVDGDCQGGAHCEAGVCVEDGGAGSGCAMDSDCAPGYHCDEAAAVCAADVGAGGACVMDGDCAVGYHCTAGTCVVDGAGGDGCVVDADCAADYHCDEAAGV